MSETNQERLPVIILRFLSISRTKQMQIMKQCWDFQAVKDDIAKGYNLVRLAKAQEEINDKVVEILWSEEEKGKEDSARVKAELRRKGM